MSHPDKVYALRLDQRRSRHRELDSIESLISNIRLVIFLAAVALGIATLTAGTLSPLWLLAPLVAFIVAVVAHDVVIRRREQADAAVRYYERGLNRIAGDWVGQGNSGDEELVPAGHPYVADLDIFGKGSLFELLCTAQTRAGEHALASWLLQPARLEVIARRQEAVRDLTPRLDVREALALLSGGVRSEVSPEALARWGEQPAAFPGAWRPLALGIASLATLLAVGAAGFWAAGITGPLPLIVVALIEWVAYRFVGKRLQRAVDAVGRADRELNVLAGVGGRLERESLNAPLLKQLHERLAVGRHPMSQTVRQLDRLANLADAQRNPFFAPIGFLLMWPLHIGLAIEAWRLKAGGHIRLWLDTVGEFEALCSLASYAYEHPSDPFPELVALETNSSSAAGACEARAEGPTTTVKSPQLIAEGIGHPLIAEQECIRNDVSLGHGTRAWIVSGSNMSGKTTLLRTLGVNVALALAGAPVRARSMQLTPLALGATIRIHDSLQANRSRFYAEIQRIKQLMDIAEQGQPPLLFLLDEILHGTNSRDRQVGATALINQFLALDAIGVATTHDLAIAESTAQFCGQVANKHFCDHLQDGQLAFDYTVRDGVIKGSNAIALMRAVGLKMPQEPPSSAVS